MFVGSFNASVSPANLKFNRPNISKFEMEAGDSCFPIPYTSHSIAREEIPKSSRQKNAPLLPEVACDANAGPLERNGSQNNKNNATGKSNNDLGAIELKTPPTSGRRDAGDEVGVGGFPLLSQDRGALREE